MGHPQYVVNDHETILKLIPQRPPMVMVDRLIYSEEVLTRSDFMIREENIFVKEGFLQAPGLIENIAQTAALRVGYQYWIKNEPAPPGYIGAIKQLVIHHLPALGEIIETEIRVEQEIFGITLVNARSWSGDTLLAECQMKTVV